MRTAKKLLAMILTVSMIFSMVTVTTFAADQTSESAGVRIAEKSYDSANQILTMNVQVKLPSATGITSAGVLLSYDSSVLTLMHKTNSETTYTPAAVKTTYKTAVKCLLKSDQEESYTIVNADLYGNNGRAGFFVGMGTTDGPSDSQKTTDWMTIFELRFKVNGDAASVLNSDSIRIADPVKDSDVVQGSYGSNDFYTASVEDAGATPSKFYHGKMTGNSTEVSGTNYLMDAEGNASATYTGSTNQPPKPALTGTPTISGTVKVGETLTAGVANLSDKTNITYQWFANGNAINGATSATYQLTASEAGKTITVKVTATNASAYSGTVTSAATAAVANASQAAPTLQNSDIIATTDTTITVTANAAWEYSKDNGGNWQTSNMFTGLTPNTTYGQICVRLAAKTGYDASLASNTVSGQTKKSQIGDEAKGTLAGYTGTYDGSAHDAVTGAAATGYTVQYSTTGANSGFSATMPKVTNVADSKTVWVKLSKDGYEDKVFPLTATVSAKDISAVTINLGTQNTYSGSSQDVVITSVMDNTTALTANTDYTITSGGSATNVEAITLTITGKGNYTGTKTIQWTLLQKSVNASMIASVADQPYTGSAITPKPAVTDGSALAENTDFTYSYEANTYVGTATVKITGKGNYTGTASKTFSITAVNQTPVITSTATVTKGGNTVDLKPLVTNAKGTVSFAISGSANGCSITDGVLTSGDTAGSVTITVNITAKNVDSAGANEYNAYTGANAITVTVENKQSAALSVTQTGCTYGDTLANPTYNAPAGTTSTTITYNGTVLKNSSSYNSSTKPTEAGTYTVTVSCETSTHIYTGTSGSFTIAPKSISGMTVTLSASTKEYTGSSQSVTVSSVGSLTVSDYTVSGSTSGTDVGNYTVTVTGKGNYTGTANAVWKITPKAITISGATATNRGYVQNDKSVVISGVTFTGASLTKDTDYTVTGIMDDANAGNGKTVNVTVTLINGNYSLATNTTTTTVNISKASAQTLADISGSFKHTVSSGEKAIGSAGMPADAGTLTYTKGSESKTGSVTISSWAVDSAGKVTYNLTGGAANDTITLPVGISSTNYADSTVNVKFTLTAKDDQATLTVSSGSTVTYGQTLTLSSTGGSGTGTVTYEVVTGGTGAATITGNVLTPITAGTVMVKAVKAADADYNQAESAPVTITINKATPTGTPAYTAITTSGKTLADAALTAGTITPAGGTIAWDLGNAQTVAANTAYNWTYTPADTTNYNNLTGSITPYEVSYGGGGGISTYAITVDNAKNGTITVSPKSAAKGATVTITVKPDEGYELDTLKVVDKNGDKVAVSEKNGKYTFTMPASKVTVTGTFAEIEQPMVNPFIDVKESDYFYNAVMWAVKSGVTKGTSATTFSPGAVCTRAQMATFLWRAAGSPDPATDVCPFTDVNMDSYYGKAVLWAVEKGITNGTSETTFSPEADCTRAQMVAFLCRMASGKAASSIIDFTDVSADAYYAESVQWAVENGITLGTGDGTTFSPNEICTRAQMVTFLYRFFVK